MNMLALLAGSLAVRPITVSGNWGSTSVSSPAQAVSSVITLTVPPGNPGVIRLQASNSNTSYHKNGAAGVGFTDSEVAFANGDTLGFRYNNPSGGVSIVTVTDKASGLALGGGWSGAVV